MRKTQMWMAAAALVLPMTLIGVSAHAEDAKNYSSGDPQTNKSGTGGTVSASPSADQPMKHHATKHHMKKKI